MLRRFTIKFFALLIMLFAFYGCDLPSAQSYTVIFIDHDDKLLDVQSIRAGDDAMCPGEVEREGHMFTGWSGELSDIQGDKTFQAMFEILVFDVSFYDADRVLLEEQRVPFGHAATPPEAPLLKFHVFKGWDGDVSDIRQDSEFQAQYAPYVCACASILDAQFEDKQSHGRTWKAFEDTDSGQVERYADPNEPAEPLDYDLFLTLVPEADGSTRVGLEFAEGGTPWMNRLCTWETDTGNRCALRFDEDLIEKLRTLEDSQQFVEDHYENGIVLSGAYTGMLWEKSHSIGIGCHDGYVVLTLSCHEKVYEGDFVTVDKHVQFLIQFPIDGSHPPRWGLYERDGEEERWTQNWHYSEDEWSEHFPD